MLTFIFPIVVLMNIIRLPRNVLQLPMNLILQALCVWETGQLSSHKVGLPRTCTGSGRGFSLDVIYIYTQYILVLSSCADRALYSMACFACRVPSQCSFDLGRDSPVPHQELWTMQGTYVRMYVYIYLPMYMCVCGAPYCAHVTNDTQHLFACT